MLLSASVSLAAFNDIKTSQMFHKAVFLFTFRIRVDLKHQSNLLKIFRSLNKKDRKMSPAAPLCPDMGLTISNLKYLSTLG